MTVGSLFAGIGGFDLGFERAGFEIKWQVEIDPFCRKVLEKHWPQVRRYEDVREVHGIAECPDTSRLCRVCLATIDVLCGGFPCQPHSLAGRRDASADERDLWPQFARLIRDLRPRWIVAENVPGLLSSESGWFFGTVLRDLAASGYDAEWDCLPAVAFGAPHRRDRVWVIAYPQRGGNHQSQQAVCEHDERGISRRSEVSADAIRRDHQGIMADADLRGCQLERLAKPSRVESPCWRDSDGCREIWEQHVRADLEFADSQGCQYISEGDTGPRVFKQGQRIDPAIDGAGWWDIEPGVGRVADGIPARMDRLRGLGNSIVPQIAEWIAHRINEAEDMRSRDLPQPDGSASR